MIWTFIFISVDSTNPPARTTRRERSLRRYGERSKHVDAFCRRPRGNQEQPIKGFAGLPEPGAQPAVELDNPDGKATILNAIGPL